MSCGLLMSRETCKIYCKGLEAAHSPILCVTICNHMWLISCTLLVWFRYVCYTFAIVRFIYRPCEVVNDVNVEPSEDNPEDGDALDEDVEDDVHTDKNDHAFSCQSLLCMPVYIYVSKCFISFVLWLYD